MNILLITLLTSFLSHAEIYEGVDIPTAQSYEQETLVLQGRSLRTATWFNIKIYTIAFYAKAPYQSEIEISAQTPLRFDITFLRDVSLEDSRGAWLYQFKESNTHFYPQYENDLNKLVNAWGQIKDRELYSIILAKSETILLKNGRVILNIEGENFQKSFLSLWFGQKPVSETMKRSLLGK